MAIKLKTEKNYIKIQWLNFKTNSECQIKQEKLIVCDYDKKTHKYHEKKMLHRGD